MSDPTDVETLARRFLDLWQEQVGAAAGDPATADMVRRLAEATAATPATWLALWTGTAARAQHGGAHEGSGPNARPEAARPATAGVAPGDRDRDVAELAERVAILERRVAQLEAAAAAAGGSAPRRGTRKRGS